MALLMFPEGMVDMALTQDTQARGFLPPGHFDSSVDTYRRPHRWSEGEGHAPIEIAATPEGVVGSPSRATAAKATRPVAAILKYLTLTVDHILDAFPPGELPPTEQVTLRTKEEIEPYLKEPLTPG